MNFLTSRVLLIIFSLCIQIQPGYVHAGNLTETSKLSLKVIRDKIHSIKNRSDIDETLLLKILKVYYAIEDNLEDTEKLKQQIKQNQQQLKSLPVEIKQLQQRVKKAQSVFNKNALENLSRYSNDKLEQRLLEEKANLNELQSTINQLKIQIEEQAKRPVQIRQKIAEIKLTLSNIRQQQTSLNSKAINDQESEALRMQLESRSRMLNAMLTSLDMENIVYPLSLQAHKLKLQLLNVQSQQLNELIRQINAYLFDQRQKEINKVQTQLILDQKNSANKDPLIQQVTTENIHYTELLQKTNKQLEKYLEINNKIAYRYKQLEQDFQSAEQKINLAGLSPALGNLLREQRRNLPLTADYQTLIDKIQNEIATVSLGMFQLSQTKKQLLDINQTLNTRMNSIKSNHLNAADELKIRQQLESLLESQKKLVATLASAYTDYARTLADLDFSLHQLVTLGEKFRQYLDERLLWVPSAPVINKHYLKDIAASFLWVAEPLKWQRLLLDIKNSVQQLPWLTIAGFVIVGLPLWFRHKINTQLKQLLAKSSKPYSDRFRFTFYSLGYVVLLVLPLPLLVFCVGWQLKIYEHTASFSQSVAKGLIAISVPIMIIQFFYRLFQPNSIMQSIFDWQEQNVSLLHQQLKWLRFVVIPAIFIIAMFSDNAYSEHSYSLGRFALIAELLAVAYFLHRLGHPEKGLATIFYQQNPVSWITLLRYFWYCCLVFTPLIIIGFAITGYYQSAVELQHKLVFMLRLIFFTALFHEVVLRWMILTNRRLALQNARKKRKLQEHTEDQDMNDGTSVNPEEEVLLDIPKINDQSKKLLNVAVFIILIFGFWLNIRDILPAFSIFEHIVLWQHLAQVDGQEVLQPVTLINAFIALVYLLLMLILIKNFPGLIDMLFAGRYSMTAGSRYAFIHLTRYAVIVMTFIAIANELGGSWSQVQWLVAAVSVGLGFGLQEIFANMVSGIILLFERPIRVGDTVTVGDINGRVSRIQMRATTITDWDQKELIVPNKTFITDNLINWSLSDTITRVTVEVGISYDSDVDQAIELMKQIIEETPKVLKDPEPSVYFMGFGDSSLDFNLRVYVAELNSRLPVIDQLHQNIMRTFKAHNIEIPFPQRDLHIRSNVLATKSP